MTNEELYQCVKENNILLKQILEKLNEMTSKDHTLEDSSIQFGVGILSNIFAEGILNKRKSNN